MELEDQPDARSATAGTSIELQVIEDAREEAEGEAESMGRTRLAIPCTGEAALQAEVSGHFGHCDSYAIVTIEEGRIETVESVSNKSHTDCSSSVRRLVENGVGLMLVQSMGMRPYFAFKELGIEVRCGITGTVGEAVESYLNGETSPMGQDSLCEHRFNTDGLHYQE
jgi:predicted Fe-Mo cluster-binding NifX family protein